MHAGACFPSVVSKTACPDQQETAEKVKWSLAPAGDHGILPPGGNVPHPQVFEEAHILPLKASGGYWVTGRTSQGYMGAASTRDGTAQSGWTKTGYATYYDNRHAPAEIRPLTGRMMPGVVGGATGLKHPRGPLTPKRSESELPALS